MKKKNKDKFGKYLKAIREKVKELDMDNYSEDEIIKSATSLLMQDRKQEYGREIHEGYKKENKEPATDKQIAFLQELYEKLGKDEDVSDDLTKEEASKEINKAMEEREEKKQQNKSSKYL